MDSLLYAADKNPFESKIYKIINKEFQFDEDVIESLQTISDIYTVNNIHNRRNLKSLIEKSRLNLAESFLSDIESLKSNLDTLSNNLDGMMSSCDTIKMQLQSSKCKMEELVSQTNLNQSKESSVNLSLIVAKNLLKLFCISHADWEILDEMPNKDVLPNLLIALQRANRIKEYFLVSISSFPNTKLMKSILSDANSYSDKAYEKLYNWVKKELGGQCFEAVEIPTVLRNGLNELQERPILFKYVLDEYANARRNVVVESFLKTLTIGGLISDTSSKPIELRSHDPIRYASDMLAWVHQAIASEKEYIHSLTTNTVDTELILDCLNNATNGLSYPLQLRLEQILVTEHDPVLLYKINNIFQFYTIVITNLLGSECNMVKTLSEMQCLSWNLFIRGLQQQASNLMTTTDFPRHDFLPSSPVLEVTRLLEAILTCQDMSYAASPDIRQNKCEKIVSVLIEPMLQHFETMASQFGHFSPSNRNSIDSTNGVSSHISSLTVEALVYLINCLYTLYNALSRLEFTGIQIEQLNKRLNEVMSTIVHNQALNILTRTSLSGVYTALTSGHKTTEHGPLALRTDLPEAGVSEQDVKFAIKQFNAYLSCPDSMDLPELQSIAYARPRNIIRRQAAEKITLIYSEIFSAINDSANGYEDINDLRTPDEVSALVLT